MPLRPLLARRHPGTAELVRDLEARVAASQFDPAKQMVGPRESALSPAIAVRIRLQILMATYHGDYHTDAFDVPRIVKRMESGDESVWFWGMANQIDIVRRALASGRMPAHENLEIGTVTVISAEEEFGPGHGELCRSASLDRTVGGKGFMLWRTLQYLTGREPTLSRRYHTLVLAARNRSSRRGLRGGEALHWLHTNYVRSLYWGIVPFYVMQGGVLEETELRESNRDPDDVASAFSRPLWFVDDGEATFAEALCTLNLGSSPGVRSRATSSTRPEQPMITVAPPSARLIGENHITVRPAPDGVGDGPAADLVVSALAAGACCVAVHVPLETPEHLGFQQWLRDQGFRLSALIPPKEVAAGLRPLRIDAMGIWTLPRGDLRVEPPFYLYAEEGSEAELAVLRHLRTLRQR